MTPFFRAAGCHDLREGHNVVWSRGVINRRRPAGIPALMRVSDI